MLSAKEDFPNHLYLTQPSDLFCRYYFKDEIDDWFKRCLAEAPGISDKPTYDGTLWEEWLNDWFGQFRTTETVK